MRLFRGIWLGFAGLEVLAAYSLEQVPTRLADDGLSTYLLAQLDDIHALRAEAAVVQQVRRAITYELCLGLPTRSSVARHLGPAWSANLEL